MWFWCVKSDYCTAVIKARNDCMSTGQKIFGLMILAVVCSGLIVAALYLGYLRFNYPSWKQFPVQGIDVSHHQGEIDWQAIDQSRYSFVFMKATEGGDFKDTRFLENWRNAKQQGFAVGAYHFFRNCTSGLAQANNFIATVPNEQDSLPPVVDLEFMGNCQTDLTVAEIQQQIHIMLDALTSYYQKQPILYVTEEFYLAYLTQGFEDYALWYRDIYKQPKIDANRQWQFWQYSNRGKISGIATYVDLNVFNGSTQDFERLFGIQVGRQ